jgi:hypothetical protein
MGLIINEGIRPRRLGQSYKSLFLLRESLYDPKLLSVARLHRAWSYDNQGLEQEAVTHTCCGYYRSARYLQYEGAIRLYASNLDRRW